MSILADSQIHELCKVPNFVITTNIPVHSEFKNNILQTNTVDSFSYLTEDQIKEQTKNNTLVTNPHGIVGYRELNEEEITEFKPMVSPFINGQIRVDEQGNKIISYGLSSAGYDVRLTNDYKVFTNINNSLIDPLNFDEKCLHDHKGDYCIIPPHSYILGVTVETFNIPNDVMVVCVGKSTYARCGAIINCTPIEPGFKGNVVIEIANSTSLPLKVYSFQGIAQFLFFKMDKESDVPYSAGNRKYQNQTGLTLAKV